VPILPLLDPAAQENYFDHWDTLPGIRLKTWIYANIQVSCINLSHTVVKLPPENQKITYVRYLVRMNTENTGQFDRWSSGIVDPSTISRALYPRRFIWLSVQVADR
jgi:hypothetical protein